MPRYQGCTGEERGEGRGRREKRRRGGGEGKEGEREEAEEIMKFSIPAINTCNLDTAIIWGIYMCAMYINACTCNIFICVLCNIFICVLCI